MNPGAPPTTRSPDFLVSGFFGAPAACWRTRTTVMAIIETSQFLSPLSTSRIICRRADSPQRLKRVYVLRQSPSSAGKSRHGEPVRMIHSAASKDNRLPLPPAPKSPGLARHQWIAYDPLAIFCPSARPHLIRLLSWKPDANTFPQLLTDPGSRVFYGGIKWFS